MVPLGVNHTGQDAPELFLTGHSVSVSLLNIQRLFAHC